MIQVTPLGLMYAEQQDPEVGDMYRTNPQFHAVVNVLSQGVTEEQLLGLIKELCKINETSMKRVQDLTHRLPQHIVQRRRE